MHTEQPGEQPEQQQRTPPPEGRTRTAQLLRGCHVSHATEATRCMEADRYKKANQGALQLRKSRLPQLAPPWPGP
ncbi:hypothetical protein GCM10010145_17570 [Streptomyces ruber]|uniref:Uncharacterized protein n=2 Tax=Streptomyces TaxID=1883 RepID=A0A918BBG5_9ACTN|nr:hypothetical protein GCM10010145_17570 [Streptomyces ruber]